jgi:hypothetical protein
MVHTSRRAQGDDSIDYDHGVGSECTDARHHKTCSGRWRGVISLGTGPDRRRLRRKVNGQTQPEVKDKLRALHEELSEDLRTSRSYTIRRCVEDCRLTAWTGIPDEHYAEQLAGPLLTTVGSFRRPGRRRGCRPLARTVPGTWWRCWRRSASPGPHSPHQPGKRGPASRTAPCRTHAGDVIQ